MTTILFILFFLYGVVSVYAGVAAIKRNKKIKELERTITQTTVVWPNTHTQWKINGVTVRSLKHFQKLTNCDDALLITLKLKYGEIK